MRVRHIPNLITVLRLLAIAPLVWLLIDGRFAAALCLFTVMGLSDAADGFLAKRYGWRSTVGEYLDPLADKAMLVSAYLTLGWLGILPGWLVAAVILRDVTIVGGAVAYHVVTRRLAMTPTWLSKVNTAAQVLLAIAVMLDQFLAIASAFTTGLIGVVLFTTVASGLHYVLEWSRRTRAAVRA